MNLHAIALAYRAAGLSTIRIATDGTKKPRVGGSWKPYQERLPTDDELRRWFAFGDACIGVVNGAVSGGRVGLALETVDIDEPRLIRPWREGIEMRCPGLGGRLLIEQSPSGGIHASYRCAESGGNTKLTARPETDREVEERLEALRGSGRTPTAKEGAPRPVTTIETRGEGGYLVVAPSPGYLLEQGDWLHLPVLTPTERGHLLDAARVLTEYTPPEKAPAPSRMPTRPLEGREWPRDTPFVAAAGDRPGDDYNARGDVEALLEAHGWTFRSCVGEVRCYARPGKDDGGVSASFNFYPRMLHIFSTNAAPFEAGMTYSPFHVFALLEHDGDFRAAAVALARSGYGCRSPLVPYIVPRERWAILTLQIIEPHPKGH